MTKSEIVVIGAGIVGVSCAATLARRGRNVLILERNPAPGRETSSRNSEVIHAGIYYPTSSLKAQTCVAGRRRIYQRCEEHGIPHRRTGKLIVATDDSEREKLVELAQRARENGAGDVELLDADAVSRREPLLKSCGGLWSPESGIVDSHALLDSYLAEFESLGGTLVTHTRVLGLSPLAGGWSVDTQSLDGERYTLESSHLINAAGLEGETIARLAGLDVQALGYRLHFAKGDYFALAPALGPICRTLVYPVPVPGGLGIHITFDLGGRYRLGPDVEYVERPHYEIDPAKAGRFAECAQRYLPEIRPEQLSPDFAGIRPKLQGPGEPFRDFVIREESEHGAPGMITLLGLESPGLTAAGEIAEIVAGMLD